jgi:predicted PurR-regulated permease PerM
LLGIDPKAARATFTAALTLLLIAAIYAVRGTLILFIVALLFAYLLYPLVDQISRRFSPKHRTPVLAMTYFFVIGILTASTGVRCFGEKRRLI